jgi:hypothetical protein
MCGEKKCEKKCPGCKCNQKSLEELEKEAENKRIYEKKTSVVKSMHPSDDAIVFIENDRKTNEEILVVKYLRQIRGALKIHNQDGPGKLTYTKDGKLLEQEYYLCGKPVKESDFKKPHFIDAFIFDNV